MFRHYSAGAHLRCAVLLILMYRQTRYECPHRLGYPQQRFIGQVTLLNFLLCLAKARGLWHGIVDVLRRYRHRNDSYGACKNPFFVGLYIM